MMNSTFPNTKNYMPNIDGLRALAVMAVFLFHLDITVFKGGFIGVDIFFVISGYLITRLVNEDITQKRFSFLSFYARRIKRIFPALFVMMFVSSIAAILFLGLDEFGNFFKALRHASAQISNIFFARDVDYFAIDSKTSPLLHTWSLGIEEQFYLIWPVLLLFLHQLKSINARLLILSVIFVSSLAISEYLVQTNQMAAFYYLHSRAWELALGGLAALCPKTINLKPSWQSSLPMVGMGMILYSIFFYDEKNFPGLKALTPTVGTALILIFLEQGKGVLAKLLSFKPFVFVGLISYSLYLWHWPIIAFYKSYGSNDLSVLAQSSIFVATFIVSFLSYRFVESPFRQMNVNPKVVICIGVGFVILFIGASNIVKNFDDAPWRVSYKTDKFVRLPNEYNKLCAEEGGAYDIQNCIIGPNKENYEVVITGDSHAAHYIPAVLDWAKGRGLTTRIFLRGACPTWIDDGAVRMSYGKVDQYCMDLTKDFYKILDRDKHIQYVFLGKVFPDAGEAVKKSLTTIKSYNKKIVFLGQLPIFDENPHICQIKNNLIVSNIIPRGGNEPSKNCLTLDVAWAMQAQKSSRTAIKALLEKMDIPYFDPFPFVTSGFDDKGNFIYMDDTHLNRYGGTYISPHLAKFIDKEFPKSQ